MTIFLEANKGKFIVFLSHEIHTQIVMVGFRIGESRILDPIQHSIYLIVFMISRLVG